MRRLLRRLAFSESGQDLIEYALLAALLSVTSVTALQTLGPLITKAFASVVAALA